MLHLDFHKFIHEALVNFPDVLQNDAEFSLKDVIVRQEFTILVIVLELRENPDK